jgi:mRNA interferase RelE/StbE
VTYRIVLTPTARDLLEAIPDRRVREKIGERIDGLSSEPEKQGKPLTEELAGYRSLRAVGQRYRILYQVDRNKGLVLIVALGIRKAGDRKDIYALAKKLIRLKLLP